MKSEDKPHRSTFVRDLFLGLFSYKRAYEFIRANRLWEGMTRYKAIIILLVIIGLVLGMKILNMMQNAVQSQGITQMGLTTTMSMVKDVAKESYNLLFFGGMKYLVLIFFEIIIFHFVRRTLEIKTGQEIKATYKGFVAAEIRMIKVVVISYFMETVFSVLIGVVLGILNLEFFKVLLVLVVQAYFLGFVFIDNYNEILKLKIKESEKLTRQFAGVSIAIGGVAYLLMLIPVAGSIIAPIFGGVAATLAMYEVQKPTFDMLAEADEPASDLEDTRERQ